MKPKEIIQLVEKEIGDNWMVSNAHGCDLKTCLVRPRRRSFITMSGEIEELWIVLYEHPLTLEGYKVVFNDKTKQFGLAQSSYHPYDYFLCYYDNFLKAFESM